jgi:hypothetical protein
MPIQLIIRNPLDRDAREFIQRAGVTDAAGRIQLNEFVRGIKGLGLWDSMVAWPLRSNQNAGTGTTAYSLGGLGTFNGTLVNGPTWGADGITFGDTTTRAITTTYTPSVLSEGTVVGWLNLAATTGVQVVASTRTAGGWTMTMRGLTFVQAFLAWQTPALITQGAATPEINAGNWTFQRADWSFASSSRVISRQSQLGTPQTVSDAITNTAMAPLIIGNEGNQTRSLNGEMASLAVFNVQISPTNYSALHDLYKNTLGTGLSLP